MQLGSSLLGLAKMLRRWLQPCCAWSVRKMPKNPLL